MEHDVPPWSAGALVFTGVATRAAASQTLRNRLRALPGRLTNILAPPLHPSYFWSRQSEYTMWFICRSTARCSRSAAARRRRCGLVYCDSGGMSPRNARDSRPSPIQVYLPEKFEKRLLQNKPQGLRPLLKKMFLSCWAAWKTNSLYLFGSKSQIVKCQGPYSCF